MPTCRANNHPSDKKQLLIVANTPSPNTQHLVQAALRGASHPELSNDVYAYHLSPLQATAEQVKQADGILLGTTENFAYMSGELKTFFDRIYPHCLEATQGLPYGLFIRAGNDGRGAEAAVKRITQGLKWKPAQSVLICRGEFQPRFADEVEQLATTLAALISL